MSEGVEWGLHCCVTPAWLEGDSPVSIARPAASFDLPAPYLNKRLQVPVRAGVLSSTPGARGGFQLARPPDRITLVDVVAAVEGADDVFRCTESVGRGARRRPAGSSGGAVASPRRCAGPSRPGGVSRPRSALPTSWPVHPPRRRNGPAAGSLRRGRTPDGHGCH
ncbi:RrF2 family transcriptional regulator [Streptomyces sp. NPDC048612]|uniref:RrF2 family transcriptional regulator n=1 Tax=Streptomyces sp. NPDC048612 TaxID=3365579 RepID=UPI00371CEB04